MSENKEPNENGDDPPPSEKRKSRTKSPPNSQARSSQERTDGPPMSDSQKSPEKADSPPIAEKSPEKSVSPPPVRKSSDKTDSPPPAAVQKSQEKSDSPPVAEKSPEKSVSPPPVKKSSDKTDSPPPTAVQKSQEKSESPPMFVMKKSPDKADSPLMEEAQKSEEKADSPPITKNSRSKSKSPPESKHSPERADSPPSSTVTPSLERNDSQPSLENISLRKSKEKSPSPPTSVSISPKKSVSPQPKTSPPITEAQKSPEKEESIPMSGTRKSHERIDSPTSADGRQSQEKTDSQPISHQRKSEEISSPPRLSKRPSDSTPSDRRKSQEMTDTSPTAETRKSQGSADKMFISETRKSQDRPDSPSTSDRRTSQEKADSLILTQRKSQDIPRQSSFSKEAFKITEDDHSAKKEDSAPWREPVEPTQRHSVSDAPRRMTAQEILQELADQEGEKDTLKKKPSSTEARSEGSFSLGPEIKYQEVKTTYEEMINNLPEACARSMVHFLNIHKPLTTPKPEVRPKLSPEFVKTANYQTRELEKQIRIISRRIAESRREQADLARQIENLRIKIINDQKIAVINRLIDKVPSTKDIEQLKILNQMNSDKRQMRKNTDDYQRKIRVLNNVMGNMDSIIRESGAANRTRRVNFSQQHYVYSKVDAHTSPPPFKDGFYKNDPVDNIQQPEDMNADDVQEGKSTNEENENGNGNVEVDEDNAMSDSKTK